MGFVSFLTPLPPVRLPFKGVIGGNVILGGNWILEVMRQNVEIVEGCHILINFIPGDTQKRARLAREFTCNGIKRLI